MEREDRSDGRDINDTASSGVLEERNSWLRWKHDSKLVVINLDVSSGVRSAAGFRMLSLPSNMADTLPASASLSARTATSQTETVTARPLAVHSSWHLLSSAWFRAQVCTVAPKLASSSTMARLHG
uniref:Uncharacterized protein n=1 Tax=Oryza barthii TaxID=65489 RepID=A0A0D3HLE7_9ORYZ